ncbi:hypothetical protein Riv7116_3509 [Rivularia sp. PCC 7116]|nr:hypothetical protein Riv7116_3509 [Rivularia sp. PCC 7116]
MIVFYLLYLPENLGIYTFVNSYLWISIYVLSSVKSYNIYLPRI